MGEANNLLPDKGISKYSLFQWCAVEREGDRGKECPLLHDAKCVWNASEMPDAIGLSDITRMQVWYTAAWCQVCLNFQCDARCFTTIGYYQDAGVVCNYLFLGSMQCRPMIPLFCLGPMLCNLQCWYDLTSGCLWVWATLLLGGREACENSSRLSCAVCTCDQLITEFYCSAGALWLLSALSTWMPHVMPSGSNAQLSNSCCCVCIYDQPQQAVVAAGGRPAVGAAAAGWRTPTSCMNFLQTGRMSLERVAENIITCFSWGVFRKISCTSRLISEDLKKPITFSTL